MNRSLVTSGLSLLALAVSTIACAPPGFHDPFHTHSYKDSYELSEGSCSTSTHAFEGDSESDVNNQLCSALQDNAANNYCASSSRQQLFYSKCSGHYSPR